MTHAHQRTYTPLVVWLAAAVVALAGAAPAHAQAAAGDARVFVTVNGGLQTLTSGFSEDIVFTESGGAYPTDRGVISDATAQEESRFESDYRFENSTLFDVSGGVRVAPYFALGVGMSRFMSEETAGVSAQVPHPIFFDRNRSISGPSPPLTREETAIHLQALVVLPLTRSFTVTGFGGPTFFEVQQQLVTDVNFTHAYPYETAEFASAVTSRESAEATGFNVGVDVAFYFTGNVGVGWLTRYSRATVELPSASGETLDIEAGGLHTTVGLRLRF
ncbi:MAG: outer membrane beta-barrel protein [Acidobacteria bacterium]|nr:outer membrane beta-barrel protein [Acidobacteriota bacterium]